MSWLRRLLRSDPYQSPAIVHWGTYLAAFVVACPILAAAGASFPLAIVCAFAAGTVAEIVAEILWRRRERARERRNPHPWDSRP